MIIGTGQTPQDHLYKHLMIIRTCQTPHDHLHMSITSGLSAHVKHLNIICTGQTPQYDLHMPHTASLHMPCTGRNPFACGFAFNTQSLWTRSVLVVVHPCPCWQSISSRQVQHLHKYHCSQSTKQSQAFAEQQRQLGVKSHTQSHSDLHCMSLDFPRDHYTTYFHAQLLECVT